jgi:hypothetical protein
MWGCSAGEYVAQQTLLVTIKRWQVAVTSRNRYGDASSNMVIWKCSKCSNDNIYVYQMLHQAPTVAKLARLACRLRRIPNKAKDVCISSKRTWVYTEITWDQILVCLKILSSFNKIRDFCTKAFIALWGQRDVSGVYGVTWTRMGRKRWKRTSEVSL